MNYQWDDKNRIKQTLEWLISKKYRYNDLRQGKKYIEALESLHKQFQERGDLTPKQKSYLECLYELYFKALGFDYCQTKFTAIRKLRY